MTVLDTIGAAIVAALTGAATEIEVEPAGDPSRFPALGIVMGGLTVLEREASLDRYQLALTIDGFVDGEGGAAPTAERNVLHAEVVSRLSSDEDLAQLIELIDHDDARFFTATLSSVRRLGFAQDFAVQFVTARGNPALPA